MKHKGKPEGILGGFLEKRSEDHRNPVRVETGKPTDLAEIDAKGAAERLEAPLDQKAPKRSWPKKSLIKGNKTKLSIMTLPEELLDKGDPRYKECLSLANGYRKVRARELVVNFGYVSSGCSSMLSSAALSLAASRYVYGLFAEERDVSLLQLASKLGTDARQSELAAYELCARESKARKQMEAANSGLPWLTAKSDQPKRGRGRPRKDTEVVNAWNCGPAESSGGQAVSPETEATDETTSDGPDGPGEPHPGYGCGRP